MYSVIGSRVEEGTIKKGEKRRRSVEEFEQIKYGGSFGNGYGKTNEFYKEEVGEVLQRERMETPGMIL